MCNDNEPDCLNCPYPDCIATAKDIQRQWRHNRKTKLMDNPDKVVKMDGRRAIPIRIGNITQDKYNHSEKGKARLKRYYESDKGKENERRKRQRNVENGRNAERCRRYRERKKLQKNLTGTMQVV